MIRIDQEVMYGLEVTGIASGNNNYTKKGGLDSGKACRSSVIGGVVSLPQETSY